MALVRAHQPDRAQQRADELGEDRRKRGAPYAQREHGHEQQIEHDVEQRRDDEEVQRRAAVAHGAHDPAEGVVHHHADRAGKDDADIGDGELHHVLGRAHQAQQPGRERRAGERQQRGGDQVEGHGGVDRQTHLFLVPRAEEAGDDDARADRDADEEADEQKAQVARRADGGERAVADEIAHDQRVRHVIELLKQVPDEHGRGKAEHLSADAALGHQKLSGTQSFHLKTRCRIQPLYDARGASVNRLTARQRRAAPFAGPSSPGSRARARRRRRGSGRRAENASAHGRPRTRRSPPARRRAAR